MTALAACLLAISPSSRGNEILPPGFRPKPPAVHALVGGKVVVRPGEVLDAAHTYRRFGGFISRALWSYLVDVANEIVEHWQEPDAGIWEMRGEPEHFLHSRLMCWVALDRGVPPLKEWLEPLERLAQPVPLPLRWQARSAA